MPSKTYRPKADAEGLSLTASLGGDVDGRALNISPEGKQGSSWPYTTDDHREQRILDAHPLVTDQPPKKTQGGNS